MRLTYFSSIEITCCEEQTLSEGTEPQPVQGSTEHERYAASIAICEQYCERMLATRARIGYGALTNALSLLFFPKSPRMADMIVGTNRGLTLGLTHTDRDGPIVTPATRAHLCLAKLIGTFWRDVSPHIADWTSIRINKNTLFPLHRDTMTSTLYGHEMSYMTTLGQFENGAIWVECDGGPFVQRLGDSTLGGWPVNPFNNILALPLREKYHMTLPFTLPDGGARYSVLFYNVHGVERIRNVVHLEYSGLCEYGFPKIPTPYQNRWSHGPPRDRSRSPRWVAPHTPAGPQELLETSQDSPTQPYPTPPPPATVRDALLDSQPTPICNQCTHPIAQWFPMARCLACGYPCASEEQNSATTSGTPWAPY